MNRSIEDTLRDSYRDLVAESERISPPDSAFAEFSSRLDDEIRGRRGVPVQRGSRTEAEVQHAASPPSVSESAEINAICDQISGLITGLTPAGRRAQAAMALSPRGSARLSDAGRHLTGLLVGVCERSIDRDDATRLIRLAVRDLKEAALHINAARRTARRRHRRRLEDALSDIYAAVMALEALRPRVIRLFDDSKAPDPAVAR